MYSVLWLSQALRQQHDDRTRCSLLPIRTKIHLHSSKPLYSPFHCPTTSAHSSFQIIIHSMTVSPINSETSISHQACLQHSVSFRLQILHYASPADLAKRTATDEVMVPHNTRNHMTDNLLQLCLICAGTHELGQGLHEATELLALLTQSWSQAGSMPSFLQL